MPKSELSKAAQVMNDLNLNDLVFFVVRRATDEQWEDLYDLLGPLVETRVPLQKGQRQMMFCHPRSEADDYTQIDDIRFLVKTAFGPNCRISVRMCKRVKASKKTNA